MLFFDSILRVYNSVISPPITPRKRDDAIRIGLIGASTIAPFAVITPAKSHPDVIVAAVAARDINRAEAYARRYDIPVVHSTYQALLEDPSIDAVYIALPNSYHYEWSLRSVQAGKHVLLEKPSCSNATEAKKLFKHPLITAPNAPVLLEAFHYQFHPAWQTFLTQVHQSPGSIESVSSQFYLPRLLLGKDDIRFKYSLAGGCLMDVATYCVSSVRQIVGRQIRLTPVNIDHRPLSISSNEEPQIDEAVTATFLTPNSQIVRIQGDLASAGGWFSLLPASWTKALPTLRWPMSEAVFEPVLVESIVQEDGVPLQHVFKRTVRIWNHMIPYIYHRIDTSDQHTLQRGEEVIRSWNETSYKKAYNWPSGDKRAAVYKDWWSTYRCQLEEFVNKIKGRQGSGVWIDGEESIAQMETIDRAYEKAGLGPRPTSNFEI
ncbi:NAD(P)-binding protein [Penicillium cosmopolitanum]|uniref:D-xylose 1-dehydrogenase (NADP(+), D-xylono-1,5-lactone-forming) n=1 Tax=Penicillium cosmopolitanum TaxID=1131564 RepID=A0A9X0B7P9_9EURO|nr:NAD(P)-binding protein [Penicillium cosmopolitanum]KAJ5391310.1 NAD(P)-binding protein [Penicillium cosmopolitanum]